MFNEYCCCFFNREGTSLNEGLLNEQQELQYNGVNYQISTLYELYQSRHFKEFLYKTPLTENIYGGWKIHVSLSPRTPTISQ